MTAPDQVTPRRGSAPANQTRLAVPVPTVPAVSRPRVLRLLNQASQHPVTMVTGGPGAGKTLAVADWVRQGRPPGPVIWVSLTPLEADAHRLWVGLREAAAEVLAGEPFGWSESQAVCDPEPAMTFLAALGRLDVVLVLDDVHLVEGGDALRLLEEVVRHPPAGLHLILISRHDPTLPLHRLRVAGALGDVRAADLAFNRQEAGDLFAARALQLPDAAVDHLTNITDGWPSGLSLAALSLAGSADPVAAAVAFDGSNAWIGEYVLDEIDSLDDEQRTLMLATSMVDQISAPLAVALTANPDAWRILHELAAGNHFMLAGAGWYRLHQLVKQALRGRLLNTNPELARSLWKRAAVWFEEQGEGLEALRFAVESRDWDFVGELALRSATPLAFSADRGALEAQLAQIPAPAAIRRPELRIVLAYGDFCRSDLVGASAQLKWAEQELPALPQVRRDAAMLALELQQSVIAYRRGEVDAMAAHAVKAEQARTGQARTGQGTAVWPGWGRLPGLPMSLVAIAQLWSARPGEALEMMSWVMAGRSSVRSQGYLALAAGALGSVQRSRLDAERALGEDAALWSFHRSSPAWLALAWAVLRQGDLAAAGEAVRRGELANSDHSPLIAAGLRLVAAERRMQLGDIRAARQILAELDVRLASLPRVPWLAALRTAVGVRLELAAGASARAEALLVAHDAVAEPAEQRFVATARARLLLATGRAAEVRDVLADELGHTGADSAEAWLLVALADDALRRDASATEALGRALDAAVPEGLLPLFRHPDRRLTVLLRRYLDVVGRHREFVAVLLDSDAEAQQAPAPVGVEPLTERERSVLAYLPTLSSNQEIAGALDISVNTVKQHLKSINRKLGVNSRRDAVRVAGRLDLLPRTPDAEPYWNPDERQSSHHAAQRGLHR